MQARTLESFRRVATGFIRFNQGVLGMAYPWQAWVGLLVAANVVAPLFFLSHFEAKVVLGVGLFGIAAMSALTERFGFSRIVGLGHVAWLPLLAFLLSRLGETPATDAFGIWLRVVIAVDAASLVFDAADVVRFARGERTEIVPTGAAPQE